MAKRSIDERHSSGLEDGEPEITPPASVRLILCRSIKLNITGPVTGNHYVFDGAGSMVDVDSSDAPGLLAKRPQSSCCGGSPSPYFVQQ